jgi:hypothetical protein
MQSDGNRRQRMGFRALEPPDCEQQRSFPHADRRMGTLSSWKKASSAKNCLVPEEHSKETLTITVQ